MRIVQLLCAARNSCLALGSTIVTFGCASIWGFQDARDLGDADLGGDEISSASVTDASTSAPCVCAPVVPPGWRGPYAILHLDGGSANVCPDPFGSVEYQGGVSAEAGAPTCHCGCGSPTGIRCGGISQAYYSDALCRTSPCARTNAGSTDCFATSTCAKPAYVTVSAPAASGGLCTPVTSIVDASAPTWTPQMLLCGSSGPATNDGCSSLGSSCLPHTQSPLDVDTYCVAKAGVVPSCPQGFTKMPAAAYSDDTGLDTRGCTACTCTAPAGATCTASMTTYGTTTCSGTGATAALPLSCAQVTGSNVSFNVTTPVGGACTPDGGVPMGAFVPNMTTVCCVVTNGP